MDSWFREWIYKCQEIRKQRVIPYLAFHTQGLSLLQYLHHCNLSYYSLLCLLGHLPFLLSPHINL